MTTSAVVRVGSSKTLWDKSFYERSPAGEAPWRAIAYPGLTISGTESRVQAVVAANVNFGP